MGENPDRSRSDTEPADAGHDEPAPTPGATHGARAGDDSEAPDDASPFPAQVVEPNPWRFGLVDSPAEPGRAPVSGDEVTRTPLRLMLVDDSPVFLGTLRRLLETLPDVDVVGSATSGREALELLNETRPEILLMDLVMPDLDGLEVARRLRQRPERPRVILMSIHDLPRYRIEARSAGADAFLTKSDLVNQLQPLIGHLLDQSSTDWIEP